MNKKIEKTLQNIMSNVKDANKVLDSAIKQIDDKDIKEYLDILILMEITELAKIGKIIREYKTGEE